jgi:putative FmdB family regulatory protein
LRLRGRKRRLAGSNGSCFVLFADVVSNGMPIYEYKCAKCGKTIEVIQKMSDKPLKKHADCGGALTKLISAAGFQFKGTGWYVTDYARKGAGDSAETAKDTKTESKDASSNGNSESSTKATTEKAGKKDSPKSGKKKD